MSRDLFITKRRSAIVVEDSGGYDLGKGECNPAIFVKFVDLLLGEWKEKGSLVIWEPFAGHTGVSKTQDYCKEKKEVFLISFDLAPIDGRVYRVDSTASGPGILPFGLFFHPPYFGTVPFSKKSGEISLIDGYEAYLESISKTIGLSCIKEGYACVICRQYRHNGKEVRLPEDLLALFEKESYKLREVWISEPDVVLIVRRG